MSTSIVETKLEIISDFQNLQPEDVQKLSDRDFLNRMNAGIRTFSALLQPFAADFFRRWKESKKQKRTGEKAGVDRNPFLAYTDVERAAINLTGYSVRQLRNIAKGTPTPKKKAQPKPLPPAEKEFQSKKRELEAKLAAKHEARAREQELSALESELAAPATDPEPVKAIVVREKNPVVAEVAKRDAQERDEAIRILNLIVFAVGTKAAKKATKEAIRFLRSIGEFKAVN